MGPVPVSLCRAMGADVVIAVDLNWDLIGRRRRARVEMHAPAPSGEADGSGLASLFAKLRPASWGMSGAKAAPDMPSMLDVLATSLNIMQVRITHSRLAGEPADAMIRPRLSAIAAMDYHRANEAIAEGERAADLALPAIRDLLP